MKTTTLVLILFLTALGLWAQTPPTLTPAQMRQLQLQRLRALTNNAAGASAGAPAGPGNSTTTPDASAIHPAATPRREGKLPVRIQPGSDAAPGGEAAGYKYNFPGVDVGQVLDIYSDLVGRTLIRGQVPQASITLKTQSPLTKTEAIEALQAVLALNGITLINIGDKFVKVLPPDQAGWGRRFAGQHGCGTFAGDGFVYYAHSAVATRQAQRDGAPHPAFRQAAEQHFPD